MKERYGKSLSILLVAILLGSIFVLPCGSQKEGRIEKWLI
jgi:hypothetical protein